VPYKLILIPGNGPSPRVASATWKVPDATGVKLDPVTPAARQATQHIVGTPLPDNTFESIIRPSRVI